MANALKQGHLKGAAIDVFDNEPINEKCPLLGLGNVLLTPHKSGISREVIKRIPHKVA